MWADFYLAFNISACIIDGFKGGMIKYKERGSVAVEAENRVSNTGQKNTPVPEDNLHPTLSWCTLRLCTWQTLSSEAISIAFKAYILQVCVSNTWPSIMLYQLRNNHKIL